MRIKSTGVAIEMRGEIINIDDNGIDALNCFIQDRKFPERRVWFALDKDGVLYAYNHEPRNTICDNGWAAGNDDSHRCAEVMNLTVKWEYADEWKQADKTYTVADIKRMIDGYYNE